MSGLFTKGSSTPKEDLNEEVSQPENIPLEDGLIFSRELESTKRRRESHKTDVHKLMIKATKIRKSEGYAPAIEFLKTLAEVYVETQNTALVICMNKLIPYMKRDPEYKYRNVKKYLKNVIQRVPDSNSYFLNLHITMANLLESHNPDKAIDYLRKRLELYNISLDTFSMQITLADMLIDNGKIPEAQAILNNGKELLSSISDRYQLIKKERKWFRSLAKLHLNSFGRSHKVNYLIYRFLEFALDMARVLDPLQIDCFHLRKDLYYKGERGFIGTDDYENALVELEMEDKKEAILKEIFGFCFEEMPELIGITEKQLHYVPGDLESLEEFSDKKMFQRKPFKELPEIEERIEKLVRKYVE